jgi:hypothetical protein
MFLPMVDFSFRIETKVAKVCACSEIAMYRINLKNLGIALPLFSTSISIYSLYLLYCVQIHL